MIVSFRGFGALPEDVRGYILENIPQNSGETENLLNRPDGLTFQVQDFHARWDQALSISQELDKVRAIPEFAAVSAQEVGLANSLKQQLLRARNYYPWGQLGMRSASQTSGLYAAFKEIDRLLTDYLEKIQTGMNNARAVVQNRMDKEADAVQQKLLQAKKESEQRTTEAEALRAAAAAVATTNQATELKARLEYEKYVAQEKRAKAPKILGLPLTVAVPGGLAIGVAVLLMLRGRR